MNASNTSPVSTLLNAEATLVNAVAATTEKVKQVATSALPAALAELHNAVEEAKARIQSAAMLYRATLADLTFDIGSFTGDILGDLEGTTPPSLVEATPSQVPALPEPQSFPRTQGSAATDTTPAAVEPVQPTTVLNTSEQETSSQQQIATSEEASEVVVSVAANPPVEKVPVVAPRKPLEGERKGKVMDHTSGRGGASKGKGRGKKSSV